MWLAGWLGIAGVSDLPLPLPTATTQSQVTVTGPQQVPSGSPEGMEMAEAKQHAKITLKGDPACSWAHSEGRCLEN